MQTQYLGHTSLVAPQHVGSSGTRDRTPVPCIAKGFLTIGPQGKPVPGTVMYFISDRPSRSRYYNCLTEKKKKQLTELWSWKEL